MHSSVGVCGGGLKNMDDQLWALLFTCFMFLCFCFLFFPHNFSVFVFFCMFFCVSLQVRRLKGVRQTETFFCPVSVSAPKIHSSWTAHNFFDLDPFLTRPVSIESGEWELSIGTGLVKNMDTLAMRKCHHIDGPIAYDEIFRSVPVSSKTDLH